MTPDSLYPISGYWSSARTIKEIFDWRAFAGWGMVGTTNLIITVATGASQQQITKAAFQQLCGSAAAGLLGPWKPPSEPTAASHMEALMNNAKQITKSAGVITASSVCGWVSHFAFNAINRDIPKEWDKMNHVMTPAHHRQVADDAKDINDDLLAVEKYHHAAARAMTSYYVWRDQVTQLCRSDETRDSCLSAIKQRDQSLREAQSAVGLMNTFGQALEDDLKVLHADMRV